MGPRMTGGIDTPLGLFPVARKHLCLPIGIPIPFFFNIDRYPPRLPCIEMRTRPVMQDNIAAFRILLTDLVETGNKRHFCVVLRHGPRRFVLGHSGHKRKFRYTGPIRFCEIYVFSTASLEASERRNKLMKVCVWIVDIALPGLVRFS